MNTVRASFMVIGALAAAMLGTNQSLENETPDLEKDRGNGEPRTTEYQQALPRSGAAKEKPSNLRGPKRNKRRSR